MRQRAGFTLIELMLVIAIIGIIAAIAIPNLLEARQSGNEASVIGSLRTIADASEDFVTQDLDADLLVDFGTLAELHAANLIGAQLASGLKYGYHFQDALSGGTFTVNAVPQTASKGTRNFQLWCPTPDPFECEVRESDSGIPNLASLLVLASDGNPPDSIPPSSNAESCGTPPADLVPTTPALQAALRLELQTRLVGTAVGLVNTYAATAASRTRTLFATAPASPVEPTSTVLTSLDSNNDGSLHFREVAAPSGELSAADAIAGVLDVYGSCESVCIASEGTQASCETSCSNSIAPAGEVEVALEEMLAELAVMLELFGPCEVDPPGVPLVNLSGDPLAFVLLAFPALLSLPMLAPPLLSVLLLAMLGLGQRRARRTRAGQGRSVRASQHLAERSIEPGESRGEL